MPSYGEIAHLVQGLVTEPNQVHIHFKADCGQFEQTVTVMRADAGGAESKPSSRATLLAWVKAALRRVLKEATCPAPLSQEELEYLTMRGFAQIASSLTLIDNRWVGALKNEHAGEFFERQLSAAPIAESYDLEVLVRVLLEVSRSDSNLRIEEKTFLDEVVRDDALIHRLQKAPRITVAELAEVSSVKVKQTILMLAWAMAYADGSLDPQEMTRLTHLCRGFMLPEQRVRELQLAAKLSLLERYLEAQRGNVSTAELREKFDNKARAWGVCESNLGRLRAWYPADFPADTEQSPPLCASDDESQA